MADEILQMMRLPATLQGLMDGVDPALDDTEFPPLFASDLENVRVQGGKIETRLGMSLYKALAGSGDVRLLDVLYTSDGKRFRLAGRGTGAGGALYDLEQGVDSSFQSTSGGTSLGSTTQPYWKGVTLADIYYFTDRAGALRKYRHDPSSGNQVISVALPVAPSAAPGVLARYYKVLEDWSSIGSWSQSDNTKFILTDDSASYTPPGGGNVARMHVLSSSGKNQTFTRNVTAQAVPSNTIAWWQYSESVKQSVQFQVGVNTATDFSFAMKNPKGSDWYPFFADIGTIGIINYKRFQCIATFDGDGMRLGPLILPGYLQGLYRWRYTHYNPTTGVESPLSAVSNSGSPMDFNALGVNGKPETIAAFKKCCALSFTSDSGTDATTTRIRIYRNGGLPELTRDGRGLDLWCRVGEIYDQSTTLASAPNAGDASFSVASATNLAIGDLIVLERGTVGKEEFARISNMSGVTLTVDAGLAYSHTNGAAVQLAFLDNLPNAQVDVTTAIDAARADPPSAAQWIARAPDGRLWLANYSGKPTGIAISNRSTPERPTDYEVFPTNIDPITRRHPTQGWQFEIGGDSTDESITWFGFYQDTAFAFTKRHLYAINAKSQVDWGPNAVQPILTVGCINGDTVQIVNGWLYWVAPGPTVMRWDGQRPPQNVSYVERGGRISTRLSASPSAYWFQWFAKAHSKRDGHYYCLFMTPSGATTNTLRLDYNTDTDTWEPVTYYNSSGTAYAWRAAATLYGDGDFQEMYQASTAGSVYQVETGLTDAGDPIIIRWTSKRYALGSLALLTQLYLRVAAVSDTLSVAVSSGGSEYGDVSHTYTVSTAGSGDLEVKQRLHRDLNGRWAQIAMTGSVSNRPALRELILFYTPVRIGRLSA